MNMVVGSAAVASASLIAKPVESAPVSETKPLDLDAARPELRDAFNQLKKAHGEYQLAHGVYTDASRLVLTWERQNPPPSAPRAYRKWRKLDEKYAVEVNLEPKMDAMEKARDDYRAAQVALGRVRAKDINEVAIKSIAAITFEAAFPQMQEKRDLLGVLRPRFEIVLMGREAARNSREAGQQRPGE